MPQGAEASALVFSIIETSKANGFDPYEYLVHVPFRSAAGLNNGDTISYVMAVQVVT